VLSLVVALYAIRVSRYVPPIAQITLIHFVAFEQNCQHHVVRHTSQLLSRLTHFGSLSYGWHRAEILAALINGVFLLALCFSIFMEAIERFFSVVGTLVTGDSVYELNIDSQRYPIPNWW
jgi:hypothetical protein